MDLVAHQVRGRRPLRLPRPPRPSAGQRDPTRQLRPYAAALNASNHETRVAGRSHNRLMESRRTWIPCLCAWLALGACDACQYCQRAGRRDGGGVTRATKRQAVARARRPTQDWGRTRGDRAAAADGPRPRCRARRGGGGGHGRAARCRGHRGQPLWGAYAPRPISDSSRSRPSPRAGTYDSLVAGGIDWPPSTPPSDTPPVARPGFSPGPAS
jgi:hypothetical protein